MKTRLTLLAVALAAAAAGPAHADARGEVLAAFEKAMQRASYRVVSNTTSGGREMRSTIDVQLPASFHMKNPDTEVIVLPGATWMNQGGQWMKLPMDMSSMLKGMTLKAMREGADSLQDVRVVGNETIDGCESTKYAYRSEGKVMGVQTDADLQVAVCKDSGLPVRAVSDDGKGNRSVIEYDYDAEIDIRPPQ